MTGFAEGDEVFPCVSAAFGEGLDVMDLLCFYIAVLLQTQFTQRVCFCIAVTNAFPGTAVSAVNSRVTIIFFIAFGFGLGVFLAEPTIRQPGASGIGTGAFRFIWHELFS